MKKHISYAAVLSIFIILLAACSLQKSKVTGNQDITNEITRIEQLSVMDEDGNSNLTLTDLQALELSTKDDKTAKDYVEEIKWLVEHNESQHLLHETLYMREYLKTGEDIPCIPHELWHVSLFAKHGDMNYAKSKLKPIEEGYNAWVKNVEEKRKEHPQFYNSLDDLEQMSKEAIQKLKQNDYSNKTLDELDTIGAVAIC